MIVCPGAMYSSGPLFFFSFSFQDHQKFYRFLKNKPELLRKEVLLYFTVELFRIFAEKRHNAYKILVSCVPQMKDPKLSDCAALNNTSGKILIL